MKWILITLLIGVIMIIAYSLSEQYKEKFDFYSNLKNFLNQFKINLSFKREKISEFLKQVNSKKQFKIFTDEYMNYLNKGELNLSKIKALDSEEEVETPLQKSLDNLSKILGLITLIVVIFCFFIFLIYFYKGNCLHCS